MEPTDITGRLGGDVDQAIGELLVEAMSPLSLEVALSVQDELTFRADEADRLRRQSVERARYEVDLAQRRYLRVDPDKSLVAATLEAEWNNKLRALDAAQEDYERQRRAVPSSITTSARPSWLWRPTSRGCGRTPRHLHAPPGVARMEGGQPRRPRLQPVLPPLRAW